ncbi:JAB domain-containing protein, partial [Pseudothermotoga lettingae]
IFRIAIRSNATSIIVVHNHPSGDPSPSAEDKKATEMLISAGDILGIEIIDHLIVGRERYYSFRENRLLGDRKGGRRKR